MSTPDPTTSKESSLIAEFLGDRAAMGGPFAMLGLAHSPINDQMILRACQRCLSKINIHRRANTPSADEVRMAVHAAASQLLDPALRQELSRYWPEGDPEAAYRGPQAWEQDSVGVLDERLKKQAKMLIGASGGWNARSRKRLGQFARMNQLSASQLVSGIVGPQPDVSSSDQQWASSGPDRGVRGPSLMDPSKEAMPWIVIPAAYGIMGLALLWTGYAKHQMNSSQTPATVEVVGAVPERADRQTDPRSTASQQPQRRHFSAILFELEKFQNDGVFDAQTAEQFSDVARSFTERWTEFGEGDLERAVAAVRGVLDGVLSAEVFDAATQFLAEDPDLKQSVLWIALRDWLSGSDGNIPGFGELAHRGENGARSFETALGAAYSITAQYSTDDPEWWDWWINQLKPRYTRNQAMGEASMLEAVYARLVTAANAQQLQDWEQSTRSIVKRLDWGNAEQNVGRSTRVWLMGVVIDPAVRSDRLSLLTKAMVVYSSASGLDVEMVVGASDTMEQREAYLASLRDVWVNAAGDEADIRGRLIERIMFLLKLTEKPMSEAVAMQQAIELGRVNSACWALAWHDEAVAMFLIDDFETPMEVDQSTRLRMDLTSSSNDEAWATAARNLDDRDALISHLDLLHNKTTIGPKSAHGSVYLAVQAPDLDVRDRAERVILARRGEVAILIALDRIAGSERLTRRMTDLVLSYVGDSGGTVDADRPETIRRLLLDELARAGVFAGSDSQPITDFEHSMNELLSMRRRGAENDSSDGGRARDVYETMVSARLAQGQGIPEAVRAELMVGLRNSSGAAQESIAYQSAVLGLLADQIKRDYPAHGAKIDSVLRDTRDRLMTSGSVAEQVAMIERGLAQIWLVVLRTEGMS